MFDQQTIQENWDEIKGKLRSRWGELTDDDLEMLKGNVQLMVGAIQRKTGETLESVERFLEELATESASAIHRAGESVRAGAHQAADTLQGSYQGSVASLRKGYSEIEDVVRQRPAKSLMVSFGVGIITGVVAALLSRRR
jgi:uncharacterized protein YjbJ (UPF0337 family)